jgi:hypothetical protein
VGISNEACLYKNQRQYVASGSPEKAKAGTFAAVHESIHGTKATSRTPSMYVDEKSDEAIVLAKRLNKERQLSAEVVEGRASPKGNSH